MIVRSHSLDPELTANIRAELARRGRTQEALAQALGLSSGAISQRLNGGVRITVNDLKRIAEFLEVDPAELLKEAS